MKLWHGCVFSVLVLIPAAAAAPQSGNADVQEQLRRIETIAEQAVAQNKTLQKALEETRSEVVQLRRELDELRSRQAARPGSGNDPAAVDTAARLDRIQDQVEINATQIREQAQTKVESDSRFGVKLFGSVLYNMFYNSRDSGEQAVPLEAPASSTRIAGGGDNFGATVRQTSFGFAMSGPKIGSARLSGSVDFDFYGGSPGTYGTDVLGALRMRTATARLDGRSDSLALGLMEPMVSPLSPKSMASVYYPALGESGNLWQWVPQVTVEHRLAINGSDSFALQGGVMIPTGDNFYGKELQGRPGYEFRTAYSRKLDPDRRFETGVGGYVHPQPFGFGRSVNSYAVTGDWVIPIHRRLELSGEAYYGQSIALQAVSGPEISSLFGFNGPIDDPQSAFWGIHSAGGWFQLTAFASPRLEFNAAWGLDDPSNRDIVRGAVKTTSRLNNRTLSLNSIYRLRSNFVLGFEYRRLWTAYPDLQSTNNHINLAVGYLF
jgi:hypothetical protein